MTQDKQYVNECVELNCATRVFEFLKKNVKQDIPAEGGSKARLVADKKTEEGGDISTINEKTTDAEIEGLDVNEISLV